VQFVRTTQEIDDVKKRIGEEKFDVNSLERRRSPDFNQATRTTHRWGKGNMQGKYKTQRGNRGLACLSISSSGLKEKNNQHGRECRTTTKVNIDEERGNPTINRGKKRAWRSWGTTHVHAKRKADWHKTKKTFTTLYEGRKKNTVCPGGKRKCFESREITKYEQAAASEKKPRSLKDN